MQTSRRPQNPAQPVAPSNTARYDRATQQWYVPAVNGAQSNLQGGQSMLQKAPCQQDSDTYFPRLASSAHDGEWTCDPLTGRNYWSGRGDSNYVPDYSGTLLGAASARSPRQPTERGWLGVIKQRYDSHLLGNRGPSTIRGLNPGVSLDRAMQPMITSGAGILDPETNLLRPQFTGLGKQAKPAEGIEAAFAFPNVWRTPKTMILPPNPKSKPMGGQVVAMSWRPDRIKTQISAFTQRDQDRVVKFMQQMPVQTTESNAIYFAGL